MAKLLEEERGGWPLEEDWLVRGIKMVSSQQEALDWLDSGPTGVLARGVDRVKQMLKWREWLLQQQAVGLRWNQDKVNIVDFSA